MACISAFRMLYADKRALETNLKVSLLKIREKELHFYTQNCIAIGTQAALLSGFAYAGIIQVDIPDTANELLKSCYLCVTTAAMGFELIAVLNSTLCSMMGPGLALRGPDGSMHRAVDGLMMEYRVTFLFFGLGLIAFHLSALLFAWLEFSPFVAMAMTVALVMFIYGMFRYTLRIYNKFQLPPELMVTGRFNEDGTAETVEQHNIAQQNNNTSTFSRMQSQVSEFLNAGIVPLPPTEGGADTSPDPHVIKPDNMDSIIAQAENAKKKKKKKEKERKQVYTSNYNDPAPVPPREGPSKSAEELVE